MLHAILRMHVDVETLSTRILCTRTVRMDEGHNRGFVVVNKTNVEVAVSLEWGDDAPFHITVVAPGVMQWMASGRVNFTVVVWTAAHRRPENITLEQRVRAHLKAAGIITAAVIGTASAAAIGVVGGIGAAMAAGQAIQHAVTPKSRGYPCKCSDGVKIDCF